MTLWGSRTQEAPLDGMGVGVTVFSAWPRGSCTLEGWRFSEVIVRMEVDVEVIDNVVEEGFDLLYRRNTRLLCVLCHHFQELFVNTQYERVQHYVMTTNEKRGCLTSACSTSRSTTTLPRNSQSKHPRKEYIDTRKVCVEATRASRTLRRVYDTPPWPSPCIVFAGNSSVVVSKYKNKASVTPFNM